MNKTLKFLMIGLVAIISIASCKKEIDFNAGKSNNCQLTTLTTDLGPLGKYTINYFYDASGKISKATSDGQTNTYAYSTNKITATDEDGYVAEIVLENGRAVSSGSDGVIVSGGISYDYTRKYTYNAEGYLVEVKNYLSGVLSSTDVLTYSNGNLVKGVSTDANLGFVSTTTYSYSTELALNTYEIADPLSYHVDYFPGGYYGKQSKNVLVKTSTKTVDSSGDPFTDDVVNYSYQFDAKGNASALTFTQVTNFYPSGGPMTTDTYTAKFNLVYNCK
ncbi:hypothetical protein [Pedobacter paludis]|uniref:DUF4595 domain-containing protein n=1 Tax=Pedobacter paludis TaxID=2203212 RepID=A0A317F0F6_9SPHI|nr:hypothetical protein [Pedobacter paludis]PWS30956.1 hypothetical protein DF947_15245 [Pedobacter paludis]